MPKPLHLVSVWNPAYEREPMEATLHLFLSWADRFRSGTAEPDDVYVWWGKIRSPNRQQPLEQLDEILAIDAELGGEGPAPREVHLYLTDYRSLYVGHVGEIAPGELDEEERDHVPGFYRDLEMAADCWFKLFDIRRLVSHDTLGVIEELRRLRNTRYHDRPVSIYGGMTELPLLVTRDDGTRYFEAEVRAALTDNRLWAEHDATRGGTGQMEQELRENLIGDEAWKGLEAASRSFIATAELVFREHRHDVGFDFTPVVVNLSKAFELQGNLLLRRAASRLREADRRVNVDGRSTDVADSRHFSLAELGRIMGDEQQVNAALRNLPNGRWVAESLPAILHDLADRRNPAAHARVIPREEARDLRARLLGIGCRGELVELGLAGRDRR